MHYFSHSSGLFAALAVSALALSTPPLAYADTSAAFTAHNAESTAIVDTAPYEEIISALSVRENGRTLVAYDVAHARALPFFSQYLAYLESIPVADLNRDEQLAYWINTRNVLLVQALAEEGRVRSFKKKRGTPQAPGKFWTEPRITVDGTPLSLHDIEQDILLAGWEDPNIIFGLYQGMKGGPALARQPFTGASIHAELAEAGRLFAVDTRNFRVRGDTVRISTYFDWYLDEAFSGDEIALRTHLATLAKPEQQALVREEGKLDRRKMSTDFEQYKTRQVSTGFTSGGSAPRSGFGS